MDNVKTGRKEVPPRPVQPDETCCVCCDNIDPEDDLTACKYGCGRHIHTDCLMRCFKHNASSGKKMECPLCRTNWGDNALEVLNQNRANFRKKKAEAAKAEKKAQLQNQ